jgi:hypothetical protein
MSWKYVVPNDLNRSINFPAVLTRRPNGPWVLIVTIGISDGFKPNPEYAEPAFSLVIVCGLVATVPGCRLRGPGFYSRRHEIF